MKHTGRMWTTLGVALVVVLHVNADDVCPDTVSQGGGNAANASFILHDSVGGVGGTSLSSASFQLNSGYAPQVLSGCNCVPCDYYISQACDALQLNQQTNFADARALIEAMFAGSDLYSVDICGDGSDGAEGSQACAEFVLQFFQLDGVGGQPEPENNLPVIDNLTLTPSDPCDTPIVASVTVSDADMDAVTVSYQWLVNDVIVAGATGSVLNSSNFVDDDIVKCVGTPHDGSDYGIAVSESVTVVCPEPEPESYISIESITVSGLDITVTVNLSNAHHWHYSLDNGQVTMVFGNSTTFSVASPGTYDLTVYAVGSNHSQIGDTVETTFIVEPEPEAGFTVAESGGTTVVAENAGTDTFTVVLDAQPASDVVLTLSIQSTAEATVSAATLTFTTNNWDVAQTVTVTGVDDNFDRDDATTVTVAVDDANSDDAFDAVADQVITITCTDDDTAEAAWKHQNMAWVFGSDQLSIRDPTLNNPQPASFSWSMVPASVKSIYYPGGNDYNPQRYTKSFTDINATGLTTFDDYKNVLDEAMSAGSDVSGIINLGYIEETQLNGEYVPVGGTDDIVARTSNPHVGHIRFMVFGDDVISGSVFASTTYIPDPSAGVNNAVNRSRSLDVRFRDTAFVWDDDTINPGNNVNGFFFKKIAMHEIGHALGFAHNSDSESVMGGGTYTYSGLGAADVAGAVAIYGQP